MAVRLNLPALEADSDELRSAGNGNHSFEVSRRQALGFAGAVVAAGTPALKALETGLSGSFSLSTTGGRAVFRLHGQDRWIIDPKRFGGAPSLKVDRSTDLIRIRLSHAVFPGTDIPADFRAEIRNGITGWRMSITFALARFNGKVAFEPWLAGQETLRSSAIVRRQSLKLDGESTALTVGGIGELFFSPDWSLRFTGADVAQIQGEHLARSGDVTVRLMTSHEPSVLRGSTGRRTLVTALRGNAKWELTLPTPPVGSSLEAVNSGFDAIHVESRLGRLGQVDRAFEAVSRREGPALIFRPAPGVLGYDMKLFGLPIRDGRLAVVSSGGKTETAVTGSYHDEPAWMHYDTATLVLGRDPRCTEADQARKFVLHTSGAKTSLVCQPSILAVATGLNGAVVEPHSLARPTRLEIVYGARQQARAHDAARLTVHHTRPAGAVSDSATKSAVVHELVVPNYVVSILRPEDLLALRLEYYGFDLVVGGGNPPVLVQNLQPGQKNAYMLAYFAPQNIAEEAYLETQPSGAITDPSGGSASKIDPVGKPQRNIAGQSRLAFDIFNIREIAYSLEPVQLPNLPSVKHSKVEKAGVSVNVADSVLDWSQFIQRVATTAQPPGFETSAAISQPTTDETSIESPYRLMLSPNLFAYWNHTEELKPGPKGEVELWHTRLGVRDVLGNTYDDNNPTQSQLRTVRAIWSPDYTASTKPSDWPPSYSGVASEWNPYRASLDAWDRYNIVRLTSDFNSTWHDAGHSGQYVPVPVDVTRLALSTLGAWMNVKGEWPDSTSPDGLNVVEWIHRATMARDQYVKVVYAGNLFPFGHKAVLIKITARAVLRTLQPTGAPGPLVAYLFQKFYIQIRQPIKTFTSSDYPPYANWQAGYSGREMPFKSVEFKTLITPDLADPNSSQSSGEFNNPPNKPGGFGPEFAFWPLIYEAGASKPLDFLWHIRGTDWDGNTVDFTMPLAFLSESLTKPGTGSFNNYGNLHDYIVPAYRNSKFKTGPNTGALKSLIQMKGQKLAFAESNNAPSANGADPAVATNSVMFNAAVVDQTPANDGHSLQIGQPQFYPRFVQSDVEIPSIKHMLGKSATTLVAPALPYLQNGFDGAVNKGEVFLNLVDPSYFSVGDKSKQLGLIFGKGDNGQVVTPGTLSPNMSIAGLSRSIGPVGSKLASGVSDFSNVASGQFDPTEFLGDPSSLLGGQLPKLFGAISLTDILGQIPDFTQFLNKVPGLKVTRTDKAIMVHFFWETEQINPWPTTSVSSANEAVLAPWLIDPTGTELLPMKNGKPRYTSGPNQTGNIVSPKLGQDSPPPPPELAFPGPSDPNSNSVDGGGSDPTHVWTATYVFDDSGTPYESVASLGNVLSMPDDGSDVVYTVQPSAHAKHGINIYRSLQGTAWPLYRISSGTTIDAATAMGSNPITKTDSNSDSDIGSNPNPESTWMQFGIDMQFTVPLDGSDPTYSLLGEVAYASLQMDVIAVPFVSLTFKIQSGQKLITQARVNDVVFTGPFQFVNSLRDFLDKFDDPPFLDVSDTGIDCGYTLTIPTIAVGAFSLQNIALGAKVTVPFFGDSVVVGFLFCSKDKPFILTIYIFGGGGWFEIDIAPNGLVGIHAGLEFGIDCALDLGIASGSVHVMAGIYFDYDAPSKTTSLTGFVDMGGSLDVLGLISVSVDFHMQLTYTDSAGSSSVTGEASLTVDVKVFFFSFSVTLGPIRKTFGGDTPTAPDVVHHVLTHHGSDSARAIGDFVKPLTWTAYSDAFAA